MTETDTAITISGDGAQLTMKKQSDVWVLIVTILNLPPNTWSRAANIIIPLVIPGPSSPGNVESFVYVLYEELAKCYESTPISFSLLTITSLTHFLSCDRHVIT